MPSGRTENGKTASGEGVPFPPANSDDAARARSERKTKLAASRSRAAIAPTTAATAAAGDGGGGGSGPFPGGGGKESIHSQMRTLRNSESAAVFRLRESSVVGDLEIQVEAFRVENRQLRQRIYRFEKAEQHREDCERGGDGPSSGGGGKEGIHSQMRTLRNSESAAVSRLRESSRVGDLKIQVEAFKVENRQLRQRIYRFEKAELHREGFHRGDGGASSGGGGKEGVLSQVQKLRIRESAAFSHLRESSRVGDREIQVEAMKAENRKLRLRINRFEKAELHRKGCDRGGGGASSGGGDKEDVLSQMQKLGIRESAAVSRHRESSRWGGRKTQVEALKVDNRQLRQRIYRFEQSELHREGSDRGGTGGVTFNADADCDDDDDGHDMDDAGDDDNDDDGSLPSRVSDNPHLSIPSDAVAICVPAASTNIAANTAATAAAVNVAPRSAF